MPISSRLRDTFVDLVGGDAVLTTGFGGYLTDEAQTSGLRGHADAVVLPRTTTEVAGVLRACYEHELAVTPRGGGTGYSGGAIPRGGIVLGLERMTKVRSFDPLLWRIQVEAGVRTQALRNLARESGLLFPPDPGAAESSQIGGNIATNAGGPHTFKYGATGRWVTGLEAVLPSGDVVEVGGPLRKDVAGYDLKSLLVGSEGTLAVITSAWLSLIPVPEAALPVVALYPGSREGCAAIEAVIGSGLQAAALEFLDERVVGAAKAGLPRRLASAGGFMVIAEADGSVEDAHRLRDDLLDALSEDAKELWAPEGSEIAALWRWRESVSGAVTAQRGGKLSEDIAVPIGRLQEAIDQTVVIGRRHRLETCSWGHAGDGNLHSTFLIDPADPEELDRANAASKDLFALATNLGGTVSGEHGIGLLKAGQLRLQWGESAIGLHEAIKEVFDPKRLLNPGKKVP
jgi:glycolate oxidase subunit GlcD